MLNGYLWFDKKNIKVVFTERDREFVDKTFVGLKEAIKFLSGYFRLGKSFPLVRAILVPNRGEFDRLVIELLKVDIKKPSRPSRIAQTQRTDLVLLSPSAYSKDSIYEYNPEEYKRLIFHETAHIFEEYLSPNIEALPRWWGEGLAVYLSGQWKYEDEFREPVLEGLKIKEIPKFEEIKGDTELCYQWGWTIVKYIEFQYGQKMIVKIVRECADGNVIKIIGEPIENFEKEWKKYLENEKIFNFG